MVARSSISVRKECKANPNYGPPGGSRTQTTGKFRRFASRIRVRGVLLSCERSPAEPDFGR